MKTNLRTDALMAMVTCATVVSIKTAFGLGWDYPSGELPTDPSWPAGMTNLVNITNRIGGLAVNGGDEFFFSGTGSNFNAFLADYSRIESIERHRLVLHDGAGEAFSLGGGNRRPCDWKLDGGKGGGADADFQDGTKFFTASDYVLEVHFWTGGNIPCGDIKVPKDIELAGNPVMIFRSITNGMTRADVEGMLKVDGGLQSASPVRFAAPAHPWLKVDVEFDLKRKPADQDRAISSSEDKVMQVSKPYVERPILD